jgi:hypothetical protein
MNSDARRPAGRPATGSLEATGLGVAELDPRPFEELEEIALEATLVDPARRLTGWQDNPKAHKKTANGHASFRVSGTFIELC